jgi:hypothetical protein
LSTMREGIDGIMITGGGFMVAGLGDVNGDGINDIMIVNYPNWQGQSNSYVLSFPEDPISVPPTIQPSSFPSSQPSSVPSVLPTVTATTNTPTNLPILFNSSQPFVMSTARPTKAPKSSRPSMSPTTTKPSARPTVHPTHSPTFLPSFRRAKTNPPTTSRPSSSVAPTIASTVRPTVLPTLLPTPVTLTVFNDSFHVIVCDDGGNYFGRSDQNEIFQVTGAAVYYHITARPQQQIGSANRTISRKIIVLKPARNLVVVDGFDREYDLVDLTAYPTILSLEDISFKENPLQLIPLTGQAVNFPSFAHFTFTKENFLFHDPSYGGVITKSFLLTIFPFAIVLVLMFCYCFPLILTAHDLDKNDKEEGNKSSSKKPDAQPEKNETSDDEFYSSSYNNDRKPLETIPKEPVMKKPAKEHQKQRKQSNLKTRKTVIVPSLPAQELFHSDEEEQYNKDDDKVEEEEEEYYEDDEDEDNESLEGQIEGFLNNSIASGFRVVDAFLNNSNSNNNSSDYDEEEQKSNRIEKQSGSKSSSSSSSSSSSGSSSNFSSVEEDEEFSEIELTETPSIKPPVTTRKTVKKRFDLKRSNSSRNSFLSQKDQALVRMEEGKR